MAGCFVPLVPLLGSALAKAPRCYVIMHPVWRKPETWCVLSRDANRIFQKVAEVSSYASARAVIPTGLRKHGTVLDLEFWE